MVVGQLDSCFFIVTALSVIFHIISYERLLCTVINIRTF